MNLIKNTLLLFVFMGSLLSQGDLRAEKTKLCLTMIVKNESKIIERCLNSFKDTIDYISICDTGSDDDTVQIIEEFMQKTGIPGKVHKQPWKNFGYNRTLCAKTAQQTLQEAGLSLTDTYLILPDADMLLEVDPAFNKDSLILDSYLVSQRAATQSHYNIRLIRASLPWKSVGVTHEYWACTAPNCLQGMLNTLRLDDRDDGGCKSDKFERDIRLLTQGLIDEPNNERYLFYLAQSYKSLSQYEDAIKWYLQRIQKGGWYEEVWFSKFMIGQCYEALDQWEKALDYYLEAYQTNPDRSEPLYQIARYYRWHEQYNLAYLFAKEGSQIPYPHYQLLFISHPIYEYLFDEELSISAYYTQFRNEGFDALNRLMLKKGVPDYTKDLAYKNMLSYVQKLDNATYLPIEIALPLIQEGSSSRYHPMNPSIKKTEDGYDAICRTVNYIQIGARHFKTLDLSDPTNTVKTRNYFVKYDKNFNLLSQNEIVEDLPRLKTKFWNVQGLEDCRMFEYNNSTWFVCTTLDTGTQPQMSLCKLEDDRASSEFHVEKLIPLHGPRPNHCEKNWLPFVKNKELFMIYSYDPFVIYKPVLDETKSYIIKHQFSKKYTPKHDFSRFSGGAAPIEFDQGYLMMIHERFYHNDQRVYIHRFVYLDHDLVIQKLSKPFVFLHQGIEYCCQMTLDHSEEHLIMAIGIEDREAYLCSVDLDMVSSLLEPLPNIP